MDKVFKLLLPLLLSLYSLAVWAEQPNSYTGDKECYLCHKNIKPAYLRSVHGKLFSFAPRTGMEALGCESCHGPGERHNEVAGELDYTGPLFTEGFKPTLEEASQVNQICQQCHQGRSMLHWPGSMHELNQIACTSCHVLHGNSDTVSQDVCGNCHVEQRAKMKRSGHMPLREGLVGCMDCHAPHGSSSDGELKFPTPNDTCYQCHADKRGPYVWEHAPVREACGTCHDAHGSIHEKMLRMRQPYLCQSCHQAKFHPSEPYEGSQLLPGSRDKHLVGQGCVNCHSHIHGSNHPSGAAFVR